MSHSESSSNLNKRLDGLEKRLADKEAEMRRAGNVPSHYQKQIDEMYAKAGALREKLVQHKDSGWEAAKDELEADWDILAHSFERWVRHVDAEYRHRTK